MAIDTPVTPPPSHPTDVSWRRVPGEEEAHAFSNGAGWMRCVCRAKRWSVLLVPDDQATRNEECAAILAGDVSESELAAMDGGR
jgi:hypothetical protein